MFMNKYSKKPRVFLIDYVIAMGRNAKLSNEFRTIILEKFPYIFYRISNEMADETLQHLTQALGKDRDLLGKLWGIDKNETIFTWYLTEKPSYPLDFYKSIITEYFPDEIDQAKLLHGKFQFCNFLWSAYKNHDFAKFNYVQTIFNRTIENVFYYYEELMSCNNAVEFYQFVSSLLNREEKYEYFCKIFIHFFIMSRN